MTLQETYSQTQLNHTVPDMYHTLLWSEKSKPTISGIRPDIIILSQWLLLSDERLLQQSTDRNLRANNHTKGKERNDNTTHLLRIIWKAMKMTMKCNEKYCSPIGFENKKYALSFSFHELLETHSQEEIFYNVCWKTKGKKQKTHRKKPYGFFFSSFSFFSIAWWCFFYT